MLSKSFLQHYLSCGWSTTRSLCELSPCHCSRTFVTLGQLGHPYRNVVSCPAFLFFSFVYENNYNRINVNNVTKGIYFGVRSIKGYYDNKNYDYDFNSKYLSEIYAIHFAMETRLP